MPEPDIRQPSTASELSIGVTDAIPERSSPTSVRFGADKHAILVTLLFLAFLFVLIYLFYRCTEWGCMIFG